ncbi:6919_t:CDS:2 [Ambispora gerdemannii]|uniref:6919_t:CDS:1 n=1 Tax=Ambispora gerdemannii TaxID=144530 RepID=A0A9N9AD94_9GLOM|nr:6919_t:CDS:2 [Ambispora gerdemannii]
MKGSEVPISRLLNEKSPNYPRQIESNNNAPDVIFPRHNFFAREPPHTAVIERYQSQQILENRTNLKTIEEKNAYRLERNRIAAKLSRDRKKVYIEQLEGRTSKLSEENDALRKTITRLSNRLNQMTDENCRLKIFLKDLQAKLGEQNENK